MALSVKPAKPNVTWVLVYQPKTNNISYISTRLPVLLALKTSESTKPKVPKGSKASKGSKDPQNPKNPKTSPTSKTSKH